ncbi:MAG TPA: stage II sporulation protein P [Candidatus Fimadaptatus faecigallinarum]|uniref:Stage II sporulation protein P n=1 Tax=Candidatus Fimadaptatus faecigallinarum TaxID=2840814 RepID=A0A9D1LSF5_9FIRM|nr:stage II sporulation protein P [Candidatus Fimadaptatus faecigallinarum]
MVRIKVVKKSQLVSGVLIALAVLAVLICGWLMWRGAADNGAAGVLSVQTAQADGLNRMYVEAADGAGGDSSAVACLSACGASAAEDAVYVVEVDLSGTPSPDALNDAGEMGPGATLSADELMPEVESTPANETMSPYEPTSYGSAPTLAQILASGLSTSTSMSGQPLAGRSIFIYHTHTHESYLKQPEDDYVEISAYRTGDSDYSIVRVGEELTRQLEALGATVTHDTTDYEQDALSTSYNRSLLTLEQLRGEGRTFDLWIDMHRDAYSESGSGDPFAATVNGVQVARLMVLLGTGEGTSGGEAFDVKPDFERNLVWGQRLTEALEQVAPGITRPLMVKTGRYNQHISERCLLIEVGHNRNTLEQALGSMPYLAQAIALTLAQ